MIFLNLLFITVVLAGCSVMEKLPEVEDTLPNGYVEKRVPHDFVKIFSSDIGKGVGWIRCFTCDQDWDKLNQQMAINLKARSYRDSTADWLPVLIKESQIPEEHAAKIFKIYSSKSGVGHVMAMNLVYLRSIAANSIDTSGDYLVMVGYDLISQY